MKLRSRDKCQETLNAQENNRVHKISSEGVGKYYVHDRDSDDRHPNIDCVEGARRSRAFRATEPLDKDEPPFRFVLASPKPRRPVMVDYHYDRFPVISDKIKEALVPILLHSAEYFPAVIETAEKNYNYWALHALRSYDVMDMERSKYSMSTPGYVSWIDKLVIDQDRLKDIPLHDRLFFKLEQNTGVYLWHESVVEAVQAVQPQGIRFFPAESYSQDCLFDP